MSRRGVAGWDMDQAEIRAATLKDIPAMEEVIREAYAEYRKTVPDLPNVAGGLEAEIRNHLVWVAEGDGRLLGVVILHITEEVAHLVNVAVAPAGRGRGLGQKLIQLAVKAARGTGARVMRLATHKDMQGNIELYQRLGWERTRAEGTKVMMERGL